MRVPTSSDLFRISHWILKSSSFLNVSYAWDFPETFDSGLNQGRLQKELDELAEVLVDSPLRMGRIFERVFIALFESHSEYEVLDSGIGIFNDERQVTELDLLVKTPEGKGLHLEAAVKFYLYKFEEGKVRVVGPNGNDVLENRMSKFERQLHHGREYVLNNYRDLEFEHKVFTRGRIFQPLHGEALSHELISPNCESGVWTIGNDLEDVHQMISRWEWIAWPPMYTAPFEPLEQATHGWRNVGGEVQHVIVLPA